MAAETELVVEDERWRTLGDLDALVARAVDAALAEVRHGTPGTLAVLLADDAALASLNARFRGKDRPTNVLSFPAGGTGLPPEAPAPLGDIALAWETVAREAAEGGKTVADHASHLIVHGVLHLLGYDHECDADAEMMEAKERAALARIGIPDPYAEPA